MSEAPAPDKYCCLFHPRIRSVADYRVRDSQSGEFFQYGLCPICNNRLKKQDSFKSNISDRIEEVLRQLELKKQKKGGILAN